MRAVATLTELTTLRMSGCRKLTDESIKALAAGLRRAAGCQDHHARYHEHIATDLQGDSEALGHGLICNKMITHTHCHRAPPCYIFGPWGGGCVRLIRVS